MEILLFKIAGETFGISVEYVEAIEHMLPVTYVPKSKQYIEGLVNIRGNIIPAIDITKLFKLDMIVTKNTLILICYKNQSMALMVDDVDDVINVNEDCVKVITSHNERFSVFEYQHMVVTYIGKEDLNII